MYKVIISPSLATVGVVLFDEIVIEFSVGSIVSTVIVEPLVKDVSVDPIFPARS